MKEFSRRQFIQAVVLAFPILKSVTEFNSQVNEPRSKELVEELASLHEAWLKSTNMAPSAYLVQFPEITWSNSELITSLISKEFKANRIIEVQGLMLSQTEVALGALFYSDLVG